MCLILVGSVSAYICIDNEDNNQVKEFKSRLNILALQNDIAEHNMTEEAFHLKLKYFNPCN